MWAVIPCVDRRGAAAYRIRLINRRGYVIVYGSPKRQRSMAQIMCDYLNHLQWEGV